MLDVRQQRQAYEMKCPYCAQPPGNRCVTYSRNVLPIPHVDRFRAFEEKEAKEKEELFEELFELIREAAASNEAQMWKQDAERHRYSLKEYIRVRLGTCGPDEL
jgi:hypothetical protein